MNEPRTYRLRDPVHGLIVFRDGEPLDQLAWKLLDTPEFQRLRRIRQLGVSDFIYPSATHTRFAHSIGVFHTARTLIQIIERELPALKQEPDKKREAVAVIAALLHDLGHGPFSHTFEGVQKSRNASRRHERWTADIIRNPDGRIRPLLDSFWPEGGFCDAVADLLEAEVPADIYHAVVSSAFDADRLDYLRRDRLMTGTGAGAIDFVWLMEQVRVGEIKIEAPDDDGEEDQISVPTFCLDPKALPAAEQFLLARYTLHEQVYFHKTTRCVEQMIAKLLRRVAKLTEDETALPQIGLDELHPLIRFFRKDGETLENYLDLDDVVVTDAFRQLCSAPDKILSELARRLRERDLYKTLDLASFGHNDGVQRQKARRINGLFKEKLQAENVIKDESAKISIYTQIGGDDDQLHKRLHILDAKKPVEITDVSPMIRALREPKGFTRYYFEDNADREIARQRRGNTHE